jgi:hypothetical protein
MPHESAVYRRCSLVRFFFQRRDPEINCMFALIFFGYHGDDFIRLDLAHCEAVGDYARAGFELL